MSHHKELYINWINTQLEKRKGSEVVKNLSSMQDGVAFLQLVEVISKEPQQITRGSTLSEMYLNIKRLFGFMARKNIKYHKVSAKEIIEGNEKSIMCLILALAVYFKPELFSCNCFRNSILKNKASHCSSSPVSTVSNAAALTNKATNNISLIKMPFLNEERNKDGSKSLLFPNSRYKPHCSYSKATSSEKFISNEKELGYTSNGFRLKNEEIPEPPEKHSSIQSHPSIVSYDLNERSSTLIHNILEKKDLNIDHVLTEVSHIKKYLNELQNLLILDSSEERLEVLEEQSISKSILSNNNNEDRALKIELNELKEENLKLYREKTSLEQQNKLLENELRFIKSKLYNIETSSSSLTDDLKSLTNASLYNTNLVASLYEELNKRDVIIQEQNNEIIIMKNHLTNTRIVETNLQTRLESCSSMINSLKHQLNETANVNDISNDIIKKQQAMEKNFSKYKEKLVDEHRIVTETLDNIRQHLKGDSLQDTFESLEHSIASFMNTFFMFEKVYPWSKGRNTLAIENKHVCNGKKSVETFKDQVKVVYFFGETASPVFQISSIRLGVMTLYDFKQLINRPGSYRYFFKTVDSDFGFVWKEIFFDKDVLPGIENKVVAWIEKGAMEGVNKFDD
ncbi:dixin isoform X1 [Hydra vulgaris]|nr:dixin-like isoform X1 [Hydra vulgaris]